MHFHGSYVHFPMKSAFQPKIWYTPLCFLILVHHITFNVELFPQTMFKSIMKYNGFQNGQNTIGNDYATTLVHNVSSIYIFYKEEQQYV